MQPSMFQTSSRFDGLDINPADQRRLAQHLLKLAKLTSDGEWRTLKELAEAVGCTEPSVSARLRDLRATKHGGFTVNKKRVNGADGLWIYQVLP
jgi:DNA-binding Lrp family transcriptional regulator